MASSFFFLVFAWYGQSGWAVANLVVAAASMGFVLPFANFILDTTFTLFRRLVRRVTSIELLVGIASSAAAAACIPAGSCGADRVGGFRDRRDRLRRSLGMG